MAKTSGRTGSDASNQKKNKKKKSRNAPDVIAMKVKAPKASNPFETIWSRRKFDILGKKRKGEERRIGQARSRAIEKRKKTLLKEYEQSGKSSVFKDKRIGEQNEALDEFGKAILRSQRERQLNMKLSKKSKYNVSDGEEDDFEGLDILGRDDFEDEMLPDDDGAEEESAMGKQTNAYNRQIPEEMEGQKNRPKSKKEVMEEIISKSKFFKAQKAKEKEENEQFVEELDKKFTSFFQSEALVSLTNPSATQTINNSEREKPDDYDMLVIQMGLEMRARPSDRTKTPEEIAQEERERLERLEEERQKRMVASDDSSDEDEENPSNQKPRSLSGDDLGDSFSVNEETVTKKGWIDEILGRKDDEESASEDAESSDNSGHSEDAESSDKGSDEDIDDHEKDLSLKDWEQSDDENIGTYLEDEEEEGSSDEDDKKRVAEECDNASEKKKDLVTGVHIKLKSNNSVETVKKDKDPLDIKEVDAQDKHSSKLDIPFLIEAPKTYEELCILLVDCSNLDIITVIDRIRGTNPIKLKAENRKKMQVFYGILLQYFAVLADTKPLNIELLNMLGKPLIEMSMEIPYFAAICARQRVLRTRTQFMESIKNPEISSWPSSKTLFLLRLWSMIFPCSDFRHPVMTPATLLMCEYLMRCPILSGRDIAIGSFLCSMLLSIFKESQKFCPEAMMFLRTLLMAATNSEPISHQDSQLYHFVELKALKPLLCICETVDEISPPNFFKIVDMPEDSPFFTSDNFRASLFYAVIETLRGYVNIYEGLSSFPEIFLPILGLLRKIVEQKNMPNALRDKFKDVADLIKTKVDDCHTLRRPLQMRKQKPVPIKLLNPKFEENFVKGRDYDPDRERAELKKMKKLLKREAKGAARELRKDNYFLHEAKERDKALLEEERNEKYGKARAFLQEQEHAFKSGQLGKGRKRRR